MYEKKYILISRCSDGGRGGERREVVRKGGREEVGIYEVVIGK